MVNEQLKVERLSRPLALACCLATDLFGGLRHRGDPHRAGAIFGLAAFALCCR